jgi:hypothetical protein
LNLISPEQGAKNPSVLTLCLAARLRMQPLRKLTNVGPDTFVDFLNFGVGPSKGNLLAAVMQALRQFF